MAKGIEPQPGDVRKKHVNAQHKVVMVDRESMVVDGVSNVESFDDEEVVLETSSGMMFVRGRDLHIKQLNLADGNLEIDGYVESIDYAEESPRRGRGLFARLFR